MNGAECGACGNIQCTCDRYPEQLGWIFRDLKENLPLDYKINTCMKGILMVFNRIETKRRLSEKDFANLKSFLTELQRLVAPKSLPRWYEFWK